MVKLRCPNLHSFGHASRPSTLRLYDLPERGLSGIGCRPVQTVQRSGVCSLPCMVCSSSGTPCAVPYRAQSFRVRWGYPGGIGPEARVGVVSPVFSDQNKKGTFIANTHPTFTNRNPSDCASLQIFQKIKKDPSRSLDCAIIS